MKTGNSLIILLLSLMLTGCLSGAGFRQAPPAGKGDALIYLLRPNTEALGSSEARFFVDGTPVATLSRNSYTWIYVPVGKHILKQEWTKDGLKTAGETSIAVTWKSGKPYYHILSLSNGRQKKNWFIASARKNDIYSRLVNSKYIPAATTRKRIR